MVGNIQCLEGHNNEIIAVQKNIKEKYVKYRYFHG